MLLATRHFSVIGRAAASFVSYLAGCINKIMPNMRPNKRVVPAFAQVDGRRDDQQDRHAR